jgi:hypothetical protein
MGKNVIRALIAAVLMVDGGFLAAQSPENGPPTPNGEIGRYQLMSTPSGLLFLVDTTNGQCWSRSLDGQWHDAGNPTKKKAKKTERAESKPTPSLKLPEKSVEMTVVQREERAIPGSEGTVRLRLGDVTDGQAFLEVVTSDETLLPRKSIRAGDSVEFSVDKKKFTVRVVELRNILIGDDFAKLTIEESEAAAAPAPPKTDPPPKKRPKKKKPAGEAGEQSSVRQV